MTDQEINIAIAQACGWKDRPDPFYVDGRAWTKNEGATWCATCDLPDYVHDLNAMRSAVMAQEDATWRFQFQTGLEHRAKGLGKLVCELDAHDWAMEFCMKKALWT